MKTEITKDILIEELVDYYSFSVRYLMEKGIRCIMCGEPIWGTLEEAAREKGFTANDIEKFVAEMKEMERNTELAGQE
jgi:methionine synthase II (cobalamin-independent)